MPAVSCSVHQWKDEPVMGTPPGFIHLLCARCGASQEIPCPGHEFEPLGEIGSATPIAHRCKRCGFMD